MFAIAGLHASLAVAGPGYPGTSDWPMESRDAYHSGSTPMDLGAAIIPEPVWTRPARMAGSQVIADGKIFFEGPNNQVVAANALTGDIVWSSTAAGDARYGMRGHAYSNGVLYSTNYSLSQGRNANTGAVVWNRGNPAGQSWFSPTVVNNQFLMTDLWVCNFWSANATIPSAPILWFTRVPDECTNSPGAAAKDGVAYIGNGAGYLTAVSMSNGSPKFKKKIRDYAYVHASPMIDSLGHVVVNVWDGVSTGESAHHWWANQLRRGARLSEQGDIVSMDAATGEVLWSYRTLARLDSPPVEVDGTLIAVDRAGIVYGVDVSTGHLRWQWKPESWNIPPSPAFSGSAIQTLMATDDHVYVPHPDGHVYTLDGSTGTEISSLQTPDRPLFLAADDSNDFIYVYYHGGLAAFKTRPANEPPVANAGQDQIVDEGDEVTLDGSATADPDNDPLTIKWNRQASSGPLPQLSSTTTLAPNFQAIDDGNADFRLTVSDDDGESSSDDVTVETRNVSPTVSATDATAYVEGAAVVSATFTDPGVLDSHTATVDWGDGSDPSDAAVTQGQGWGSVVAAHHYASPGEYEAKVNVTDDDGGTDTATATIVVKRAAAIWANSVTDRSAFDWSGSDNELDGIVHSNSDLKISGSTNKISGGVEYVGELKITGKENDLLPDTARVAPRDFPIRHDIATYRPGGRNAVEAGAEYHDLSEVCAREGHWTLPEDGKQLESGVYYAPCDIDLQGDGIVGAVTLVSERKIKLSGASQKLQAFTDGVLMLAGGSSNNAIHISGSDLNLAGVSMAEHGEIQISGARVTYTCSLLGDRIRITSSRLKVRASDCSRPTNSVALTSVMPIASLALGVDKSSALPGDDLGYSATVTNSGSTIVASGIMGAENTGDAAVTAAHYSYELQYRDLEDDQWKTLASAWQSTPGHITTSELPNDQSVSLVASPVEWAGTSYAESGIKVLGTVVSPRSQAAWAYQARIALTPQQTQLLFDPSRVAQVRNVVRLEFAPSGSSVREFYRLGVDFSSKIRSQSPDLVDAEINLSGPSGDPVKFDRSLIESLARLEPGGRSVAEWAYPVPRMPARAAGEGSDAYVDRLLESDNSQLRAVARARATTSLGSAYVPVARTSTVRELPVLGVDWSGPEQLQAGQTALFRLGLENLGSAAASSVAVIADLDGDAQAEVVGAPTALGAGDRDTADVSVAVPNGITGGIVNRGTVTWTDSNSNIYGPVTDDHATYVTPPAKIAASKTARLAVDADGDGTITPGDTIEYRIDVRNTTAGAASAVKFDDVVDPVTTLIADSVTTSQGSVTSASAESGQLSVALGPMAGNERAEIRFRVTVPTTLPSGVKTVSNQGNIATDGGQPSPTDDPDIEGSADPTVTYVDPNGPRLRTTLRDTVYDNDESDSLTPGDQIGYRAKLTNVGQAPATAVRYRDEIGLFTTLQGGSVTTSKGKIWNGGGFFDLTVDVEVDTIQSGETVVIDYTAQVSIAPPEGLDRIYDQAAVRTLERGTQVTDDPDTSQPDDPTGTRTRNFGGLELTKTDELVVDADQNGVVSAGDTIEYTITGRNTTDAVAFGTVITDSAPAHSDIVPGSESITLGSLDPASDHAQTQFNVGELPSGGSVTAKLRVKLDDVIPASVTSISNRAGISSTESAVRWSDDPDTPVMGDATLTPVHPAPHLSVASTSSLAIDSDSNGVITEGDTITLTDVITNAGTAAASQVSYDLQPGAHLTLVPGGASATTGTVTAGNGGGDTSVAVAIDGLEPGASSRISYQVQISDDMPTNIKRVYTKAIVDAAEIAARSIDPASSTPVIHTNGAPPYLTASKTDALAVDVQGDGKASPGDTLSYSVTLHNSGIGAANDVVLADVPGVYTKLAAGSVEAPASATISAGNNTGDSAVEVAFGTLMPGESATVNFRAQIDNPFPVGVDSVRNQGSVASRELETINTVDPAASTEGGATLTKVTPPPIVPPGVTIVTPENGSRVTAPTDVVAQITPPTDQWITKWCSRVRSAEAGTVTTIKCGEGTPPSALGTFDPTTLPNGIYTIEVEATASGGGVQRARSTVAVDGQLKLGRYTTAYQDMSIPIHSLPIQVMRSYDSYDKRRGDFGIGWNVSLDNFKLQTNGALGRGGWTVQPSGCLTILGYSTCLSKEFKALSPHFVTIRWPDGRQEIFDFTPSAGADVYYDASAAFTGRAGTTSKLTVEGDSAIQYFGDGNIYDADGLKYFNSQRYRLTAKDGTTYVIDVAQGMQSATDRHGNYLHVSRDGIISSTGKSVSYTRDSLDRITKVTGPSGQAVSYAYSAAGDLASVTDARGHTMSFEYDARHNLQQSKDPLNRPFRTIAYDDDGRMTAITDGEGHTTQIETRLGEREQVISSPDGKMTTITRQDDRGNSIEVEELFSGESRRTRFEYDASNNRTKIVDPLGRQTTNTYDANSNVTSTTDARGNTRRMSYDVSGHLTKVTESDGTVSEEMTRNSTGDVTKIISAGQATEFTLDSSGRTTSMTDAAGHVTNTQFDAHGNPIGYSDENGMIALVGYDSSNRLISVTDARSGMTSLQYDAEGNLLGKTDPHGNSVTSTYDFAGRLVSQSDQSGRVQSLAYDSDGRLISRVDRNGVSKSFEYDAAGRIVKRISGSEVTKYAYRHDGQLVGAENDDARIEIDRDVVGRTIGITTSGTIGSDQPNTAVTYGYDPVGDLAFEAIGGDTTSYEYDDRGRLSRLVDTVTGSYGFSSDSYDRLTGIQRPNGVDSRYAFTARSDLQSVTHAQGSSVIDEVLYGYDEAGRRTTQTDLDGEHRFAYDELGGLTGVDHPGAQPDEAFTYDLLGNRQQPDASFNEANRLTRDARYDYTYDNEGNLTRKADRSDGSVTTFNWDADHRLRSVEASDGSVTRYRYDPFGRRIEIAGPSKTVRYGYGIGSDALREYDGDNAVEAKFTFRPGIDKPLAMRRGGNSYFYLQDSISSVTALTDSSGNAVERYRYSAYGQQLTPPSAVGNPFSYAGRQWDDESSTYHYRARQYDPSLGRFTSEDPVSSANSYVYAGNNPIEYNDPSGAFVNSAELGQVTGIQTDLSKLAVAGGMYALLKLRETFVGTNTKGNAGVAYHHTHSEKVFSIMKGGLRQDGNGRVFATPIPGLSPVQAEELLALPKDETFGLRDAVIGINLGSLQASGKKIPPATPVGAKYGRDGGGLEYIFPYRIENTHLFEM